MTTIDELKKIGQTEKIIFGSSEVIRRIKQGKVKKVFLASNIPSEVESDINHNAGISQTEIEKLAVPNDEFGMVFKRAHPLLAVGVMKE